jgi:murein DD-endopeptidase MepM/ murein hydrolase activator NlpD
VAGRPHRSRAGRLVRLLVTLALLALAASWLRPWAERAVKVVRLLCEAPPLALPVPVEGVRASRIANTWGASRSGGRRHEGTDIFAPRGTPVRSTTRGLVVRKGWNRLGGRVVSVIGPGGQRHYYAHLEQFAGPGPGDWVEEGDLLGFVGNSGNAAGTPTHLHYGIYAASGEALNPHPLLTATVETARRRSSRPAG